MEERPTTDSTEDGADGLTLVRHVLLLTALVVNLWIGGDLVEELAGHVVRSGFELLLILGYAWFVLGVGRLFRREEPPEV